MSGATQQFDVIVIGAGPAGAAAAATAARDGLRVALVDKARFPRQKLCGGLFSGRSMRHLQEIFGVALPADMAVQRRGIAFSFGGRPAGRMDDAPVMALTMRWDLDTFLYRQAIAAGAADETGQAIARLDAEARRVELRDGRLLQAAVLIGADGANSQVAKALFGQSFDRATIGFGLEVEAAGAVGAQAPIEIDLAATAWGYGWRFPKAGGTTIGVGGVLSENPEMKRAMRAFLSASGAAAPPGDLKGAFLPWGDFRRVPGRGAVLLAGDAAGLVDPISGEGIALAMKSGQLAARAAADQLRRPERALAAYRRALAPIHRSLRIANAIRPLIFSAATAGYVEERFRASSTLKRSYLQLVSGEKDYGDILRALALRAPRIAFGLMRSRLSG